MPIANTPKHIVQQIILLATGVPGAENIREQLLGLYEANGNWSEVKLVVDTYMNALLAEHSVPELVQAMAQNALGVTLSDSDTAQLIQNLRGRGIDSWSELFVFAIVDVQGQNAAMLDNRADAANIFTDLLGSLNKDSDYDGPQALAAAQEWLRGIDSSEASRLAAIDAAENLIPRFIDGNVQGTALDGYIRGATVFIDVNGNGIQDASEPFTTTDANGNFLFEGDLPTGSIIASGGVDIATNLPFTGMLTAPSGAIVITPLTTLVQQMLARDSGQSLSGIEDLIFTAFGLPKVDLSAFDPIQSGLASGATRAEQVRAVEFQAVTAQIMNALNVGQALLDNLVPANTNANQSMLTALVDALITAAAAGETIDLSDTATLTVLLRAAVDEAGILDADSTAGEIAQVELLSSQAAASLQEINARSAQVATDFATNNAGSAVGALSDIVLLQVVTGQLTTAIASNTSGDFSSLVPAFTGAALTAAFNVADGGDLTNDTPVNDRVVPAEPEAQLVAKLLKDSGDFGDNVTNTGTIVVTGIGENRSAEYSLDNGESWSAVGDKNAFTITENGHYKVLVRQVDGDSHAVGTDVSLTMTLFQRSLLLDESFPVFFAGDFSGSGYSLPNYSDGGRLGYSVSAAGDVNGDGFADYVVGVPENPQGGGAVLMLGGEQGISGYVAIEGTIDDNDSGRVVSTIATAGHSVSGIGDFNGDGYDDFIIGAPGSNDGNGSAFVLFGRPGFETYDGYGRAYLSELDSEGTDGFRIYGTDEGGNSYMYLGASVSGAGDVNGDGYDDVIVGAPYADDYDGASYVIFGAATGFTNEFNIDDLDGSNGFRIQTPAGGHSAAAVSSAGDVNGDGYGDVLVSATDGEGGSHAYLVFGSSKFTDTVELGNLSTSGVKISGAFNDYSHFSVSSAGDLNGDGFADIIIGAKAAAGADKQSGAAYVVFGAAAWDTALDLDDLGASGFKLNGVAWGDETGRSVSSAGDVNGDGYDDLIIGAPGVGGGNGYSRAAPADPGAAYVVFGKASGMGELNLAELDGHDGFIIEALSSTNTRAGTSVSSAGDINGDGYADLLVGAPYVDEYSNSSYDRATYVIYGGDFHREADFPAYSFDEHGFLGTAAAERFAGSFGDDSIFGGGGADVIRAGAGNDTIDAPDLDFRLIDGGGGMDSLFFTGTGNIDLGDLRGRLTSIEGIVTAGDHSNQLTLTARDVLAIADTTALYDGNYTVMMIFGDANDTVVGLATGWLRDTSESSEYVRYTSIDEAVVVLVGVEMTTDYQLPPP